MQKMLKQILPVLLTAAVFLPTGYAQNNYGKPTREKIDKGLILFQYKELGEPQFVNVLRVKKSRKVSLAWSDPELKTTSAFGVESGALAAVNAGFFDMKNGGSVTYLKVDGREISRNAKENPHITRSALVITKRGEVILEKAAAQDYYSKADGYGDVIFTGPLLLLDGKQLPLDTASTFVSYRHPRTAACTLKNGDLLLLTADGRAAEALGMSLPQLADFMQELKCRDAINLDGGGSTTLWVKGSVRNHPSDNRQFDNQGERKVANVVLVH